MFTRDAIVALTGRVRGTLKLSSGRYPATADRENGRWDWSDDGAWLGGFWPALLWQTAIVTGDDRLVSAANDASLRLEPRAMAPTALRGLLFWYGAALGDVLGLAGEDQRRSARRAAQSLVDAIDPAVGAVPPLEEDAAYDWPRPGVSVDAMAGTVPLLAWSGHLDEAVAHARGTARLCARTDGSFFQTATYDDRGALTGRLSVNGFRPDSTWARGQAWAMLGLAHARRLDPSLRMLSDRSLDWWLAHVPEDGVARWDFDAPEGDPLDTSATAIAASALMHAGRRADAERTVVALEGHLGASGGLVDGCLNQQRGLAVGSELVWGDYFLLEAAIGLEKGRLRPVTPPSEPA